MIITIDGPAGAGKSTVARRLASRLGFRFLDTGAMYRAVTWATLQAGINPQDATAVAQLALKLKIEWFQDQILVNGRDVTNAIRDPLITQHVSDIAENVAVRKHLVSIQRTIAETGNFVCEGRDQGTVVFPDAGCKFYLTASDEVRAQRRFNQLQAAGKQVSSKEVFRQQQIRDQRDQQRPVGALKRASDAFELQTDGLSLPQVVDQLTAIARSKGAVVAPDHDAED